MTININLREGSFEALPARRHPSQRGGAGEGLVQNPGLGEEVDSVFQTSGIVSNFLHIDIDGYIMKSSS